MANQDYPGVCMACTTDECEVVAPDVAAVRERVLYEPITGYTRCRCKNSLFEKSLRQ